VHSHPPEEAVDHSIGLIWDQQDALGQLLSGLQNALEGKLGGGGASDKKPQQRAKGLLG
jgi:hypothetical protein